MKIFKKLFVITFISIAAFACSSDDDSGNDDPRGSVNTDLITGEWRLAKEVDYYEGMSEEYSAECNTESMIVFTNTTITSKSDYDCDGDFDYETSNSYTIEAFGGEDNVIFSEGEPSAIILTLTQNSFVFTDDYYEDPDTGELEYTAYFYVRN